MSAMDRHGTAVVLGTRCTSRAAGRSWGPPCGPARRLSNVDCRDGCDVVGLVTDGAGTRVIGARVVNHGGRAEEVLAADLVVAATGRGSRTAGSRDRPRGGRVVPAVAVPERAKAGMHGA